MQTTVRTAARAHTPHLQVESHTLQVDDLNVRDGDDEEWHLSQLHEAVDRGHDKRGRAVRRAVESQFAERDVKLEAELMEVLWVWKCRCVASDSIDPWHFTRGTALGSRHRTCKKGRCRVECGSGVQEWSSGAEYGVPDHGSCTSPQLSPRLLHAHPAFAMPPERAPHLFPQLLHALDKLRELVVDLVAALALPLLLLNLVRVVRVAAPAVQRLHDLHHLRVELDVLWVRVQGMRR